MNTSSLKLHIFHVLPSLLAFAFVAASVLVLILARGQGSLHLPQLHAQETSPAVFRPESGFAFSNTVYDFFEYDYADEAAMRKQAQLLKDAGVKTVQTYFMRWGGGG